MASSGESDESVPENVKDMIRAKRAFYSDLIHTTRPGPQQYNVLARYHDQLEEYLGEGSKEELLFMVQTDISRDDAQEIVELDMIDENLNWIGFLVELKEIKDFH